MECSPGNKLHYIPSLVLCFQFLDKVNVCALRLDLQFSKHFFFQVRDDLEQLLDDDDDMADLYLSRKLAVASSPVSGSGAPHWFLNSPTIGSKISRTISRGSMETTQEENDVEELEMLLEVMKSSTCHSSYLTFQI